MTHAELLHKTALLVDECREHVVAIAEDGPFSDRTQGDLVERYHAMMDLRESLETVRKDSYAVMSELKTELLKRMEDQGVTSIKVDGVMTVRVVHKHSVKIDKDRFEEVMMGFIGAGRFNDVVYRQVKSKEIVDEFKAGTLVVPDGMEITEYRELGHTRG